MMHDARSVMKFTVYNILTAEEGHAPGERILTECHWKFPG